MLDAALFTDFVEIASGNFGTAYCAIYEGCLVVVKVPKEANLAEQMKEYTTFVQVQRHGNLLSLIGGVVSPSGSQLWMVTPWMSQGSLDVILRQDPTWGRTDLVRTLKLAMGMAAGLAALHAQGIIHRDCTLAMC